MNQFVDIHCHILPGVDDGAQSPEETKAMLEKAWDEGIQIMVATPHYHKQRGKNDISLIKKQLLLAQKARQGSPPEDADLPWDGDLLRGGCPGAVKDRERQ